MDTSTPAPPSIVYKRYRSFRYANKAEDEPRRTGAAQTMPATRIDVLYIQALSRKILTEKVQNLGTKTPLHSISMGKSFRVKIGGYEI